MRTHDAAMHHVSDVSAPSESRLLTVSHAHLDVSRARAPTLSSSTHARTHARTHAPTHTCTHTHTTHCSGALLKTREDGGLGSSGLCIFLASGLAAYFVQFTQAVAVGTTSALRWPSSPRCLPPPDRVPPSHVRRLWSWCRALDMFRHAVCSGRILIECVNGRRACTGAAMP